MLSQPLPPEAFELLRLIAEEPPPVREYLSHPLLHPLSTLQLVRVGYAEAFPTELGTLYPRLFPTVEGKPYLHLLEHIPAGFPLVKFLGKGAYGTAFLLSDGQVLKITTALSELECVLQIYERKTSFRCYRLSFRRSEFAQPWCPRRRSPHLSCSRC